MKDISEKNLLSYLFFGVINFTKLNYFIFEMSKKKIWANFQRIIELFTQKIVSRLSKVWVSDPGSEIRDPRSGIWDLEKTYSGSRIQGSKRHRIPDPDPQHCVFRSVLYIKITRICCTHQLSKGPGTKHEGLYEWLLKIYSVEWNSITSYLEIPRASPLSISRNESHATVLLT
jgi:hypothetical protein